MKAAGRLLPVLLLLSAAPGLAGGQTVTGRVIESGTGEPLEAAMVRLTDVEGDAERASTLTDAVGRFRLEAPAPGRYLLRAERIGFRSVLADTVRLGAGETVERLVEARSEPVTLEGIDVEGERRCRVRPDEGMATARVWDEARKALSAAAWTSDRKGYEYEILSFERRLGPEGRRVRDERRRRLSGYARNPITSRPAGELIEEGFVERLPDGDLAYYAPDALALLSDAFLETHCMRLRQGDGDEEGWIGLRFEPVRGRRTPDIVGTFWIDPATSELQRLDFRYTNFRRLLDIDETDRVGGRVVFEGLPNGTWIVREWRIRMPLVAQQARPGQLRREATLAGLHEVGGLITRVRDDEGRTVLSSSTGTVAAVALDSQQRRPLEGARIWIQGTADTAVAGPQGMAVFSDLSDGTYRVAFSTPRLDSLAHRPDPVEVEVERGEATWVRLVAPSRAEILAGHCERQEDRDPGRGAVLVGRFVEERTNRPADDALLEILWEQDEIDARLDLESVPRSEFAREGRALGWRGEVRETGSPRVRYARVTETTWGVRAWPDDGGAFVVCYLPTGRPLSVVARRGSAVGDTTELTLPPGTGIHDRTVRVPEVGSATVTGTVVEWEGEEPVAGARLELAGTPFTETTDENGRFRMVRVPEGRYPLRVEAGEYDAVADTVSVGETTAVSRLRLRVPTTAIPLEGVTATVEVLSEEERRERARGRAEDRAGPEEMERIAAKVRDVAGVLREMGSSRIRLLEHGGYAGSGFCFRSSRPTPGTPPAGGCVPVLVILDGQPLQDISTFGGRGPPGPDDVEFNLTTELLENLSPDDIESVRVLTPVEARFRYGSRGRYGAVLIETR